MAFVPECGTLGYNRGRPDNEQRACDVEDFYYPGGQKLLTEQEKADRDRQEAKDMMNAPWRWRF